MLERAKRWLASLWHRLWDRYVRSRAFVVERVPDGEVFVVAHNVRVGKDGRLIFTSGLGLINIAVFAPGEWRRAQRGLVVEDLQRRRGPGA